MKRGTGLVNTFSVIPLKLSMILPIRLKLRRYDHVSSDNSEKVYRT